MTKGQFIKGGHYTMLEKYYVKSNKESHISDELRHLLESLGTDEEIRKNTYLFYQGKNANKVYLIQSGLVQISMASAQGREITLRICRKDDIVGELVLYYMDPKYLLNAQVIESGIVTAVSIDTLHRELERNRVLSVEMLKWVNNHLRRYLVKMKDLLLNGKKGALYSTLIRLSNSYGVQKEKGILINIILTNQELADFCGITREYVNRILGELRREDVISVMSSGKIFIKDLDYLKHAIHCENCPIEICNIN